MKVQNVIEIQVKNRKMDVKHQKITDRFIPKRTTFTMVRLWIKSVMVMVSSRMKMQDMKGSGKMIKNKEKAAFILKTYTRYPENGEITC